MATIKSKKSKQTLTEFVKETHEFFVKKYGVCKEGHIRGAAQLRFLYSETPELTSRAVALWKRKFQQPVKKKRRRNKTV